MNARARRAAPHRHRGPGVVRCGVQRRRPRGPSSRVSRRRNRHPEERRVSFAVPGPHDRRGRALPGDRVPGAVEDGRMVPGHAVRVTAPGIHDKLTPFRGGEVAMAQPGRFVHTTVLAIRRGENAVLAGDGQVTLEHTVVKAGASKIRRLAGGKVLAGFAGGAADAFALLTRFEEKLAEYQSQIERASVELVREWRTDRVLRRLEAMLIVADAKRTFLLSGTGDLIEPDDGVVAIGSGSVAATAAARALLAHTELDLRSIAEESLRIAAGLDIFTNDRLTIQEI